MKSRISSEMEPRMKAFADLIYYRIVIVENTEAQYFGNAYSTMTIHLCIKSDNMNALFLATYSEPIMVFVRKTKWKTTVIYRFERELCIKVYSLFHFFFCMT